MPRPTTSGNGSAAAPAASPATLASAPIGVVVDGTSSLLTVAAVSSTSSMISIASNSSSSNRFLNTGLVASGLLSLRNGIPEAVPDVGCACAESCIGGPSTTRREPRPHVTVFAKHGRRTVRWWPPPLSSLCGRGCRTATYAVFL